jgi:two-component system LytT family sensor kinase
MKKYLVVLLHSAYWLIYLIVLSIFSMIHTHGEKIEILHPGFLGSLIAGVSGFYLFHNIFFRKYFIGHQYFKLLLTILYTIIATPVITEMLLYFFYTSVGFKVHGHPKDFFFGGLILSIVTLINCGLGLVMKSFIWRLEMRSKDEINKKNHEMELALMKAQINPHFLFNTINNIDVLILKDPVKASEYLNKLSDIMRFTLYETKAEKIPLSKELSYIKKYIELQKIRTSNESFIKYVVNGEPNNLLIEPMLFIPFIENAFKHAENKKVENAIKISFAIEKDKIKFECENAYSVNTQLKPEHSGLGNDLIQRRLALLYPNKHTFEVINKSNIYKVNLVLSLKNEN